MMSPLRNFAVLGLLAVAVPTALGGCAGESKVWSYEDETEVAQALQQHEAIVAQVGIYANEDLSRYVATVGGKLAAASERPGLAWHFTVLDSPRPHAFATRGGHVYVTSGMLALLRSENDLAAILAHEISHISTRDAVRSEVRGNIADAGGVAASVALPFETFLIAPYASGSAGMRAAGLNSSEEFEADRRGAENLRRAGYPEESMAAVMEIFAVIDAHDSQYRRPTYNPHEQDRRYAIYADDLNWPGGATGNEGGFEVFNRDYGRRSTNALYRCFADDPNPHTRQFKLRHKTLFSILLPGNAPGVGEPPRDATADPAFLTRRDGLDLGTGIEPRDKSVFSILFTSNPQVQRIREPLPRATADPVFLARLDGLEFGRGTPTAVPERAGRPTPVVLRIRKAQEGDTFASLAIAIRGGPRSEVVLRLLNQRYPDGEPVPGQPVKVIE